MHWLSNTSEQEWLNILQRWYVDNVAYAWCGKDGKWGVRNAATTAQLVFRRQKGGQAGRMINVVSIQMAPPESMLQRSAWHLWHFHVAASRLGVTFVGMQPTCNHSGLQILKFGPANKLWHSPITDSNQIGFHSNYLPGKANPANCRPTCETFSNISYNKSMKKSRLKFN